MHDDDDVQDQDPVFLNGPYSATVPEGVAPDTRIFEIQVSKEYR